MNKKKVVRRTFAVLLLGAIGAAAAYFAPAKSSPPLEADR